MSVEFKANLIDEIWEERVNAVDQLAIAEVRDIHKNKIDTPDIIKIAELFKEHLKPYAYLMT